MTDTRVPSKNTDSDTYLDVQEVLWKDVVADAYRQVKGTSINLFFRKAFTRNRDFESLQKKVDGFLLKAAVLEGIVEVSRMPFPQFR